MRLTLILPRPLRVAARVALVGAGLYCIVAVAACLEVAYPVVGP